jgi:hypothetical protein
LKPSAFNGGDKAFIASKIRQPKATGMAATVSAGRIDEGLDLAAKRVLFCTLLIHFFWHIIVFAAGTPDKEAA